MTMIDIEVFRNVTGLKLVSQIRFIRTSRGTTNLKEVTKRSAHGGQRKTEKSGEYEFRLVGHGDEWSDASSVECVPKLLTITVQQLCKPLYSAL